MKWYRVVILCLASVMSGAAGCLAPRFEPAQVSGISNYTGSVGPFAPVTLRVHPLTHLERDSSGDVFLLVHVQLRDRWLDVCKGVGSIQFQLFEPTGLGGSGQEKQVLRWEGIDLYDLDKNASFYDPATQTYRFSLSDLPDWVQQMAPGGDRSASGSGRFRVMVRLTTPMPDGGQTVLVDELVVGR